MLSKTKFFSVSRTRDYGTKSRLIGRIPLESPPSLFSINKTMSPSSSSLFSRVVSTLRTLLLTGIAAWLPIVITFWLMHFLLSSVDGLQKQLPSNWQPSTLLGQDIPGFGILMVIIILLLTGFFARNFIGMKIIALWEELFDRIPIVKTVYRGVKQISDNLFSGKTMAFREAVMVEFPRAGAWTIAFVTSKSPPPHESGEDWLGLYVPTTPNPTSGYYIWVKRSETKLLAMSVDEALKLVVSLGLLSGSNNANTSPSTDGRHNTF